tara:strand:+ start:207 stop:434 length:228 start_codon:yes stop_codon:yes gene_type:complete
MKKTKKKPKVPAKYLAGLTPKEKEKRKKEIARNKKKAMDDPSAYKFSTDKKKGKRRKTIESKYTRRFKQRFGKKS